MARPRGRRGGSRFWYPDSAPDRTVLWLVDPAASTRTPLLDVARTRAALAAALGTSRRTRGCRLPP
ncbi:MAG: hypothetical protein FJ206_07755 [Gemmatimonadetes bacterium]|nr:hypothetical protein [Gemmatimonadota bacterium]